MDSNNISQTVFCVLPANEAPGHQLKGSFLGPSPDLDQINQNLWWAGPEYGIFWLKPVNIKL